MLIIVSIMLVGVAVGYLLQSFELKYLSSVITFTILLLLFLLGVSLGNNSNLMGNLWQIGLKSMLIALAGLLGSVLMAKLIEKWIESRQVNKQ